MPTYKLARLGIIVFAFVVAYPYIPGSGTDAFKGISIFVGVLVSLGSSSFIANFIAGYYLVFRRSFKVGDRVMIGDRLGDIEMIGHLTTTLRTIKNEEISIPNSVIMGGEVVNYSHFARRAELILHSTVTIGYDVPWRQVEALLLDAAARTEGLLKEPTPFVLKLALEDFYIKYEINVYCDDAANMPELYSRLHANIVDAFNAQGVQIMSPHYMTQPDRDVVVPKAKWFEPPARPPEGGSASR